MNGIKRWFMRLWYSLPVVRVRLDVRKQDKRAYQWFLERADHGFDRRELWSLHDSISTYIRDRLVWFRKQCPVTPAGVDSHDEWTKMMSDMVYAFDTMCPGWEGEIDEKRFKRGLRLFHRYYYALRW